MEHLTVRLNEDWTGCLDGIALSSYAAGETVSLPVPIAEALLADGRAHLPVETKALSGAPQNKALSGPESNKDEGPQVKVRRKTQPVAMKK